MDPDSYREVDTQNAQVVDPDSYREVDTQNAQVVELVDTQDLKSCDLNSRIGSTPIPGTA